MENTCRVAGCTEPVLVKKDGLCRKHYMRMKRTGTTDDPVPRQREKCSYDGCDKPAHGAGLCGTHYARLTRHGDPEKRLRQRDDGPDETRWMRKVSVESPGCWMWTAGSERLGYGVYSVQGRSVRAHVYVWELLVGPVPDGLELDHLCRRRLCCNPDHLEPVTHLVNVQRGAVGRKGRGRRTQPEEVRAAHAAYMRDYMRKRRAREREAP